MPSAGTKNGSHKKPAERFCAASGLGLAGPPDRVGDSVVTTLRKLKSNCNPVIHSRVIQMWPSLGRREGPPPDPSGWTEPRHPS